MIPFPRLFPTSSLNRFLLLIGVTAASALSSAALASEVSEKFQAELETACLQVDTPEVCTCYAKSVTQRYDDGQLVTIFNLLKNKEANQMFLITHAVEGRACKASN